LEVVWGMVLGILRGTAWGKALDLLAGMEDPLIPRILSPCHAPCLWLNLLTHLLTHPLIHRQILSPCHAPCLRLNLMMMMIQTPSLTMSQTLNLTPILSMGYSLDLLSGAL
jgi:hypothetical protein